MKKNIYKEFMDGTVLTPPEICSMITVSAAHITTETADMLDREDDENNLGLCVYPKSEYGWFVYVPDCTDFPNIPDDLRRLLAFAYVHNCGILCIDGDGPEVLGFPKYSVEVQI